MNRNAALAVVVLATLASCKSGRTGDTGTPGQPVVSESLPVGSTACPHGGTQFVSASGTTYACNGAPGERGLKGEDGAAATPVTASTLLPGDPSCPAGGTQLTSPSGTTYACNGAPGQAGAGVLFVEDDAGAPVGLGYSVRASQSSGSLAVLVAEQPAGAGTQKVLLWRDLAGGIDTASLCTTVFSSSPSIVFSKAGCAGTPYISGIAPGSRLGCVATYGSTQHVLVAKPGPRLAIATGKSILDLSTGCCTDDVNWYEPAFEAVDLGPPVQLAGPLRLVPQ